MTVACPVSCCRAIPGLLHDYAPGRRALSFGANRDGTQVKAANNDRTRAVTPASYALWDPVAALG